MPRTQEQFEAIRLERREHILQSALKVFAEDGYHNASISKVSKEAGISKGLMYNYFESKEELLQTLIGNYLDEENAKVVALLKQPFTDEVFADLIRLSVEVLKKNPLQWKLYMDMANRPEVREIMQDRYVESQLLWVEKLTAFFTQRNAEDPMMEIQFFASTMTGLKVSYLMDPVNFPIDEMEKRMIKLFVGR
ncbi:MAG: TetR/AcrR family transcriptional regulator [Flavobacteriales bacterium]|nr:TetR/AcrR family transcriptional regulator [Flavobacteriales bacterium]